MRRQKTFYDHEDEVYNWINNLRQVFDVKKVMIKERFNPKKWGWNCIIFRTNKLNENEVLEKFKGGKY